MLENVSIEAGSRVGGLAGRLWDEGTIKNSHIEGTGSIKGSFIIGGLVGENRGTIEECSVRGILIESSGAAGGLVGGNQGTIARCFATVKVQSGSAAGIGGLVGSNYSDDGGTIKQSYATGDVESTSHWVGGLVGDNRYNDCLVTESYATGKVTGTGTGTGTVGGLVGLNEDGTAQRSYYDQSTTLQSDTGKGAPKSTTEIKLQATFNEWDFTYTWTIIEGVTYPNFKWEVR